MLLFPAAVTGGLALGLLRGGSFSGLAGLRLRALRLLGAVVVAQLLLGVVPRWAYPVTLGFVYVGIGVWLGLQRGGASFRRGLLLLAGGWALNVAVIAANGGMPVAEDARASVGAGGRDVAVGNLWKHLHAEDAPRLAWLGDVIPITTPGFRAVVSVGDLLLLSGVGFLVAGAMSPAFRESGGCGRCRGHEGPRGDRLESGAVARCGRLGRPPRLLGAIADGPFEHGWWPSALAVVVCRAGHRGGGP